jgi:hypothetical protein
MQRNDMGLMTSKGAIRELELRLSDNAVSTVSLEVRKMVKCGQNGIDCKAARQDHIRMPSLQAQLFLLVALALMVYAVMRISVVGGSSASPKS